MNDIVIPTVLVGEVMPEDMNEAEALATINRIRTGVDAIFRDVTELLNRRAWIALGHAGPHEMLQYVLDGTPLRLGRDDRQQLILTAADAGMTQQQIAAHTGVNQATVSRALRPADMQMHKPTEVQPLPTWIYLDLDNDYRRAEAIRAGGPIGDLTMTQLADLNETHDALDNLRALALEIGVKEGHLLESDFFVSVPSAGLMFCDTLAARDYDDAGAKHRIADLKGWASRVAQQD